LAFRSDGHRHHLNILTQIEQLNLLGPERWLAEQAHRWTCVCGATFSWYEERCQNCGVKVNSYVSGNSGST
jgi:hypothetical protein